MLTTYTRIMTNWRRRMLDEEALCVCTHTRGEHDDAGCRARDCDCEGWLIWDDRPRNGDEAEAEPSELSGRGWWLGPFTTEG